MSLFRKKYSLKDRKIESESIKKKYPTRIPIIIEKSGNSDIPEIKKKKYLVPEDYTIGQLMFIVRKRITIPPEVSIYLFIGNKIGCSSELISSIYEREKDEDGFLYVKYSGENTFG